MKNAHLLLLFLIALMAVQSARAADIVALCIGNDAYIREEDVLDTPVADARLMKQALEALPGGADVTLLTDASRADIVIALNALKERARGAKLALVFYSGHGMDGQPRGYQNEDTFLLPVEAVIPSEDHLAVSAVGLREVLAALKDCPVTARAVILDCCRTGAPKATGALVAGGTKNFGQLDERVKVALGKAVVPDATLVAFAASPGRKAASFLSEQDANSPFTMFLAEQLGTGAGNLRDLVEAAAEKTEFATERRQVPYVTYNGATSAIKQIVFRETAVPTVTPPGNSAEMEALKAQLAAEKKAREEAERKAAMANQPAPVTPASVPVVPSPAAPAPMFKTDPLTEPAFPASSGMEGSQAGEVREFGGIEMVWCPPGEFLMGSPDGWLGFFGEPDRKDNETQHRVILTSGFWMAKTETTQGQWQAVMGIDIHQQIAKGGAYGVEGSGAAYGEVTGVGATQPMYFVIWDEAQEYLTKMNNQNALPSGWKWALPSEAQWEYACRAGTTTAYAGDLDEIAWYSSNSGGKTNPVGTKKANAWGLHDMHGNVDEWCSNWYEDYPSTAVTNPTGATWGYNRVTRGGSGDTDYGRPYGGSCRSAYRSYSSPDFRSSYLGFRPAIVPSKSQ